MDTTEKEEKTSDRTTIRSGLSKPTWKENTEIVVNKMTLQVHELTEQVMDIVIKDEKTYQEATLYIVNLAKMKKAVKEYHKPLKEATHKAHKAATQRETTDLSPITSADVAVQAMILKYEEEAQKEQEKLDKKADEQAEKKKDKLLDKAENEQDPDKKQELEDQAEEIYAEPKLATQTVAKKNNLATGGGTSFIPDIEVEVTDAFVFLKAVVEKKIPFTVLDVKIARLKIWIKSACLKNGEVLGVRIKDIKRISVRTGT